MRILIIILCLYTQFNVAFGQQTVFNKAYALSPDTNNVTALHSIIQVGSNYMYYGRNYDVTENRNYPIIGMLNYKGDSLWTKRIVMNKICGPINTNSILQINDTLFCVAGCTWDSSIVQGRWVNFPFFHWFNAEGDSILTKEFTDSIMCGRPAVQVAGLDGFIYNINNGESLYSHPETNFNNITAIIPDSMFTLMTKIDLSGNILNQKVLRKEKHHSMLIYGSGFYFSYYNAINTVDSAIILSSWSQINNNVPNYNRHYITKLSKNGDTIWHRSFRPNSYDVFEGAYITKGENDSVYYFGTGVAIDSNIYPTYKGNSNLFYYGKLNFNGDTIWTKKFADTGQLAGYKESRLRNIYYNNNKLLINGFVYYIYLNVNQPAYHPTLVICDKDGKVKSYREHFNRKVYDLDNTINSCIYNDSSIVGVGWVQNFGWVIKLDSFGCMQPGCQAIDSIWNISLSINNPTSSRFELTIFPNPTQGKLKIDAIEMLKLEMMVTNSTGQVLTTQSVTNQSEIDLSSYPAGIYYINLFKDGYKKSFKVQKM
jgi:hypothetical protein